MDRHRAQAAAHVAQHQRGNGGDVLLGQGVEDDGLVHAVDEFGTENVLHRLHDRVLHGLVGSVVHALLRAKAQGPAVADGVGAGVGGHDDDGVAEGHDAPGGVGESAVLEDLQEDVEHIRVGLFHLVQQEDAVGLAADGLGQLAALLMAHIAGGRADQAGHGVLLHVLGHVHAHQGVFVAEHRFAQGLAQFGLANAGGAEEDETADGALGVLQACAGAADGAAHGGDGLLLADDPLMQDALQVDEAVGFLLGHLADRDARPGGHDLGHVLGGDGLAVGALGGLPHVALAVDLLAQALDAVAQIRGGLEILAVDGGLLVLLDGGQLLFLHAQIRRGGEGRDAHPGAGLVHQVDGLVGQVAVGDITDGQVDGGVEGLVGDAQLVVGFVALAQAVEDVEGLLRRGFAHLNGLEAAFQGRVLLDVLAILVQGRRADALQLPAGQGGLHDVRRVQAPLGGTRAHDGVQLVDEEDHIPSLADLGEGVLQALLKFAAVLAARDHRAQVEADDPLVEQHIRHVPRRDALGQALHHAGLAHAGFADEDGVVLRAADEDLRQALDLGVAADDRVELLLGGQGGQVAAVLLQHGGVALALLLRLLRGLLGLIRLLGTLHEGEERRHLRALRGIFALRRQFGLDLHALIPRRTDDRRQLPDQVLHRHVLLPQQLHRANLLAPHEGEHQHLRRDEGSQGRGHLRRPLERLADMGGEFNAPGLTGSGDVLHIHRHGLELGAHVFGGDAVRQQLGVLSPGLQKAQQQVQRAHKGVVQPCRRVPRQLHRQLRALGK